MPSLALDYLYSAVNMNVKCCLVKLKYIRANPTTGLRRNGIPSNCVVAVVVVYPLPPAILHVEEVQLPSVDWADRGILNKL